MEQVLPLATLMNPASPHCHPHEFLTLQYSLVAPTTTTPWLISFPQFSKTPSLYCAHSMASTATDTGPFSSAVRKAVQVKPWVQADILYGPVVFLQFCSLLMQGQFWADSMPRCRMQLRVKLSSPPWQPLLPKGKEQSTSCCYERGVQGWLASCRTDSRDPTMLKAQQEAHMPWFLTTPALPRATQSMSASHSFSVGYREMLQVGLCWLGQVPRTWVVNYPWVRSENWVTPIFQERFLALCWVMVQRLRVKMMRRYCSQAGGQDLWCWVRQREKEGQGVGRARRARRVRRARVRRVGGRGGMEDYWFIIGQWD